MKPLIAGRDECLSEAAMFWNMRKIEGLPRSLVNRLNKVIYTCNANCMDYFVPYDIHMCVTYVFYAQTKERLLEAERKLSEMNIQAEVRLTKQVLASYKDEIQTIAKRM